jgi:uncharacterized PurR-regulated membrane protein YhhQ (DUF165 family)
MKTANTVLGICDTLLFMRSIFAGTQHDVTVEDFIPAKNSERKWWHMTNKSGV